MPSAVDKTFLQALENAKLGTNFTRVSSNHVRCDEDDKDYFVKQGGDMEQMKGEAESLRVMAVSGLTPEVYFCDVVGSSGTPVMVSEYFNLSRGLGASEQKRLGEQLAKMHDPQNNNSLSPEGKYGFHVPTHCGATKQDNAWEDSWLVFFRDRRVGDLLRRIGDKELNRVGKELCDRVIPLLLDNFEPAPQPVIIHGDLWSGNVGVNSATNEPVIYDPSSYYGHNEVELGIMHMFGGFDSSFFEAYHNCLPRSEPYHDERIKLVAITSCFGNCWNGVA